MSREVRVERLWDGSDDLEDEPQRIRKIANEIGGLFERGEFRVFFSISSASFEKPKRILQRYRLAILPSIVMCLFADGWRPLTPLLSTALM